MADDSMPLPVTDPHRVPSVFVNQLVCSGHLNHVINVTLATALFSPNPDSGAIEPDLVITSRLRMDLVCAVQLRDALDTLIKQNLTKPDAEPLN